MSGNNKVKELIEWEHVELLFHRLLTDLQGSWQGESNATLGLGLRDLYTEGLCCLGAIKDEVEDNDE